MIQLSNKKEVKRLSTAKSALIIVGIIVAYIVITWLMGADYSDTFRRISY